MPSLTSAIPSSTFSRVTRFMRPRWSSGPKSPQLEPAGLCFHRSLFMSVVMAADPFGDQRRFGCALDLDGGVPGHLHAVAFDRLVFREREMRAHTRAAGHGRSEAHAVEPV